MNDFGRSIKEKRLSLNLSLREAAQKIGMSHAYLDKLEKGFDNRTGTANKPTPETLKLISSAYGIDYSLLLEMCNYTDNGTEPMPTNPDIRLIARAGKKLSAEQAEQLRKYAQFMFPQAFEEN